MADFDAFFAMQPAVRVHPPALQAAAQHPAEAPSGPERMVEAVAASGQVLNSLWRLPVSRTSPPPRTRRTGGYVGLGTWGHVHLGLQHVEGDLHALAGLFRLLSDDLSEPGAIWPPFMPKVVTYMRELASDLTESLDRIHAQPLPQAAQSVDAHLLDLALLPSGGEGGLADVGFAVTLASDQVRLELDPETLQAAWQERPIEAARTLRQAANELDLIAADLEKAEATMPDAPPLEELPEG